MQIFTIQTFTIAAIIFSAIYMVILAILIDCFRNDIEQEKLLD